MLNFRELVSTALSMRARMFGRWGHTFGGKRDLAKALGYQEMLFPQDYRGRYRRNAVANRIVKALPYSTWRGGMEIIENEDPNVETAFESAYADLENRLKINQNYEKVDILSRIGRYGVMLIGMPGTLDTPLMQVNIDSQKIEPVAQVKADDLAYLSCFAEEDAWINMFDIDVKSPRFGLPEYYMIRRVTMLDSYAINAATIGRRVHWSRCIHVAEGLLDDRIFGEPVLECVWNLLDDLEKVSGGGPEAFWKRADQGILFDLDPTLEFANPDGSPNADAHAATKQQIQDYEHDLKRYLFTRGITPHKLGSDVASFKLEVESLISLISAGTGIPQRVLMGSEQGKLAAKMDRSNWDDRVSNRRDEYAGPMIVRPFVERLIALGALPTPADDFDVRWPQMVILDDEQRANIAVQWANCNKPGLPIIINPDEIRERVLELPPLNEVPGQVIGQSGDEPLAARALRKKEGHVHRVADRFRAGRETRRERLLWRRSLSAEKKSATPCCAEPRRAHRRESFGYGRDSVRQALEE